MRLPIGLGFGGAKLKADPPEKIDYSGDGKTQRDRAKDAPANLIHEHKADGAQKTNKR